MDHAHTEKGMIHNKCIASGIFTKWVYLWEQHQHQDRKYCECPEASSPPSAPSSDPPPPPPANGKCSTDFTINQFSLFLNFINKELYEWKSQDIASSLISWAIHSGGCYCILNVAQSSLSEYTTISSFLLLLIGFWVVSNFGQLHMVLLWTLLYMSFGAQMQVGVELLGHWACMRVFSFWQIMSNNFPKRLFSFTLQ